MDSDFLDEVRRDADQTKAIPEDGKLRTLADKANLHIALEDKITELEAELKQAKADLAKVSELEIPELMNEIGIPKFSLKNGLEVKVAPFYAAKIPEEKAEQAFDWLEKNEHEGIIKGQFVVMYRRPDKQRIGQFLDLAREMGFETKDVLGVHPQTLKAFVREQIEEGVEDFPRELFGVYTGWKTKINKK